MLRFFGYIIDGCEKLREKLLLQQEQEEENRGRRRRMNIITKITKLVRKGRKN